MLNAGDTSSAGAARPWVSIPAGRSEALGDSVLVAAGTGAVDGGDVILRGVLDAVKQCGLALEYASEELRRDREVVLVVLNAMDDRAAPAASSLCGRALQLSMEDMGS